LNLIARVDSIKRRAFIKTFAVGRSLSASSDRSNIGGRPVPLFLFNRVSPLFKWRVILNCQNMAKQIIIDESPVSKFLFSDTRVAWFWLIVRIYVGWEWLTAGWEKVQDPAWTGPNAGGALSGFIQGALHKTGSAHPDVQGWYADWLQNFVLTYVNTWSHLVAYGELLVGIALIIGILTGIAACFGLFMNLNYLLAGTVSINPILFTLSIGLILGWKIAGYIGLDRYLLPLLGTPWEQGNVFKPKASK